MTPDLHHRLTVYRDRLKTETDDARIEFYRVEIIAMEIELERQEGIEELIHDTQPWDVHTDDWNTVEELQRDPTIRIVHFDHKWSWRFLKFMWHVRYYNKHK